MVTRAPVRRYSLPDTLQTISGVCLLFCAISTQNIPQPSRETLEISEFFRSLLRSDTQAGPTRQCPPDGYDVSWMRISQCNERWRTWEGSTARSAVTGG